MEKGKQPWMINELEIQNFKSIKNLKIQPGRVNVLIGKPNAGKSNLLEALCLLGNGITMKGLDKKQIRYKDVASIFYDQNINTAIQVNSNNVSVKLAKAKTPVFTLSLDIYFNQLKNFNKEIIKKAEANYSPYVLKSSDNEQILIFYHLTNSGKTDQKYFLPINTDIRKYHFKSIPKQIGNKDNYLYADGSNLWAIIKHNSFLKEFASSFFKEFSLEVLFDVRKNRMDIMKRSKDTYYVIDFSMTPDTFQRILYHLAAIESNKHSTILFEEPESHSYPPYIQMLAEKIIEDEDNQYFITTHSPFIVEKMLEKTNSHKDIKFYVTYFQDYQTKVHELTQEELNNITSNSVDLFFNIEAFQK